jgi:hypothetical protein
MTAIRLREKDVNKLSKITQIPYEILKQLELMNLLDVTNAQNLLIFSDIKKLKKSNLYMIKQIIEALVNEYQVPPGRITEVMYKKKGVKRHYCNECGKMIPKAEYRRNNGICNQCVVKSIKF